MRGNRKVVMLALIAAVINGFFYWTGLLSTGWSILVATLVSSIFVEIIYARHEKRKRLPSSERSLNKWEHGIGGHYLAWQLLRIFLEHSLTFLEGKELPPVVSGVLRNIPYAVLGALIFPAILYVQEGNLLFGFIGTIVAFTLAILFSNVMVVVLGTIGVLAVYSLIF